MSHVTEAHAKPSDAGIATAYVIRQCVGDRAQGGSSFNTGMLDVSNLPPKPEVIVDFAYRCYSGSDDDLAVAVSKFNPQVVCSPQPFPQDDSVLKSCQAILDQMETSKDVLIFAQQGIHSRLETALPFYYYAPPEGNTELLDKPPY